MRPVARLASSAASFTRCASPPERVVACWPSRRYPSPTEASASSVYVVVDDTICAPPNSPQLLPATTRGLIEELADAHGIPRRVAPVSEAQLRGADEVWLSAATRGVLAVTRLDAQPVAGGKPGPLWQRMHGLIEAYWRADSA